jgi:hypothetical protein
MIDLKDFADLLNKMATFFNKKLTDEQQLYYYRELKHIPRPCLADSVKTIIRNNKPITANFPTISELIELWHAWKRDHPEKIAKQFEPCPDCGGYGFISFRRWNEQAQYNENFTVNCGSCSNRYFGSNYKITMTKAEIEAKGWQIIIGSDLSKKGRWIPQEQLGSVAGAIGNDNDEPPF